MGVHASRVDILMDRRLQKIPCNHAVNRGVRYCPRVPNQLDQITLFLYNSFRRFLRYRKNRWTMIHESLWKRLWEFDPNSLVVVDHASMIIQVVNPSFCQIFRTDEAQTLEKHASAFFDDLADFEKAWKENIVIRKERKFPRYGTYLRLIIFPMKDEGIVACILVDLTSEHLQREEMRRMKQELLQNVNKVIDRQMHIAQEIAGLLGETTAEAKVSLIKIRNVLNEEIK